MPLPTRAWLSSSRVGRIVRARSIPACTLGLFCVVSTFGEVDHFPHASCRPHSNVGYVARTHFLHARGYPLPALGALPTLAPFPRARNRSLPTLTSLPAPAPFPRARGWPSGNFLPAKSIQSPMQMLRGGRRRFAARPVRAVAPDISRQLYFQRADFVPPVLHRA